MTLLKLHQTFDILSSESFFDFIQILTSKESASGLSFETLLANLLAYSNVQLENVPLQWLQLIFDLVEHGQFTHNCSGKSEQQCAIVSCKFAHHYVAISSLLTVVYM